MGSEEEQFMKIEEGEVLEFNNFKEGMNKILEVILLESSNELLGKS